MFAVPQSNLIPVRSCSSFSTATTASRFLFDSASDAELEPRRSDESLAVMWESRYRWMPTEWAMGLDVRQRDYSATTWSGLDRHFPG